MQIRNLLSAVLVSLAQPSAAAHADDHAYRAQEAILTCASREAVETIVQAFAKSSERGWMMVRMLARDVNWRYGGSHYHKRTLGDCSFETHDMVGDWRVRKPPLEIEEGGGAGEDVFYRCTLPDSPPHFEEPEKSPWKDDQDKQTQETEFARVLQDMGADKSLR